MSKYCRKCGTKNDENAFKCSACNFNFMKEIRKKQKNNKPFIIFGFVIPFILVSLFFASFYFYLYGIEKYSQEADLKYYLELIKAKNYDLLQEYLGIEYDDFNKKEELIAYFEKEYGEYLDNYIIAKDTTNKENNTISYKVQINKEQVKQYTLSKTKEKGMYIFDKWKLNYPESDIYSENIKIYAPKGIEVFINNTLVSDDYIVKEEIEYLSYYDSIKDVGYEKPNVICYGIDELMNITTIEAKSAYHNKCEINRDGNIVKITANIADDELEVFNNLAAAVSKKCAAYISEDCKFKDYAVYLHNNTTYYDTMKEFFNGWFPVHTQSGSENEKFGKTYWYDENHCAVEFSFNYYVLDNKNKKTDYPISNIIYFIKINEIWLVADVKNL